MNEDELPNKLKPVPVTIVETKQWRVNLDAVLQQIKRSERGSRERALSITKIQEAIMWLGMDLKSQKEEGIGGKDPYPSSYDPTSATIEPTADNLKL